MTKRKKENKKTIEQNVYNIRICQKHTQQTEKFAIKPRIFQFNLKKKLIKLDV